MAPNAAFVSAILMGLGTTLAQLSEQQMGTLSLVEKFGTDEGWCLDIHGQPGGNMNCMRMTGKKCTGDKNQQWAYNSDEGYVYSTTYAGGFQGPGKNDYDNSECTTEVASGEEGGCMIIWQKFGYDFNAGNNIAMSTCNATDPRQNWQFTDLGQLMVVEPGDGTGGRDPRVLCLGMAKQAGRGGIRGMTFRDCATADPIEITWQFDPAVPEAALVPGVANVPTLPPTPRPTRMPSMAPVEGNVTETGDMDDMDMPMGNATVADDLDEEIEVATEKAGGERERVLRGKVLDLINKVE